MSSNPFDVKKLAGLPSLREVSTEALVRRVEALFEDDGHRTTAVRLHLSDEFNFKVEAYEKDGRTATWSVVKKMLMGSTRTLPTEQRLDD